MYRASIRHIYYICICSSYIHTIRTYAYQSIIYTYTLYMIQIYTYDIHIYTYLASHMHMYMHIYTHLGPSSQAAQATKQVLEGAEDLKKICYPLEIAFVDELFAFFLRSIIVFMPFSCLLISSSLLCIDIRIYKTSQ